MQKTFISRMVKAVEVAIQKGARINVPVVVAQAALESGWGASSLAAVHNNLFGIKAGKSWRGPVVELPTTEWSKERGYYRTTAKWRVYASWNECILDYSWIIGSMSWYRDALDHLDDPDRFLRAILPEPGQPGWATDHRYEHKVRAAGASIEALGGPRWIKGGSAI